MKSRSNTGISVIGNTKRTVVTIERLSKRPGGWVDVAKGFPEPRERERAQSTVNLLNERMNERQENRNGDRSPIY
jgi:hypothetical protein